MCSGCSDDVVEEAKNESWCRREDDVPQTRRAARELISFSPSTESRNSPRQADENEQKIPWPMKQKRRNPETNDKWMDAEGRAKGKRPEP